MQTRTTNQRTFAALSEKCLEDCRKPKETVLWLLPVVMATSVLCCVRRCGPRQCDLPPSSRHGDNACGHHQACCVRLALVMHYRGDDKYTRLC